MKKFSIIIPVYNVEQYLKRTLDSVFKQTYQNFEVIVVNDGCTDKSMDIARKYDVKIIDTTHVGVSEARNIGVTYARGEYLLFLDSDDYWDIKLLESIQQSIKNRPDVIRFQVRNVYDDGTKHDFLESTFVDFSGEKAFEKICTFHYVESVWCYAIKRTYYNKNKFRFAKDKIHEDFGLTPLIIIKATKVNSISYVGYNYYRRSGSIMNTQTYSWTKRKVHDFYEHYLYLSEAIKTINVDSTIFRSFIANSMIMKICELHGKEYKEYKRKLWKKKIYNELMSNTVSRKIKKILVQCSPKIYYKIMSR